MHPSLEAFLDETERLESVKTASFLDALMGGQGRSKNDRKIQKLKRLVAKQKEKVEEAERAGKIRGRLMQQPIHKSLEQVIAPDEGKRTDAIPALMAKTMMTGMGLSAMSSYGPVAYKNLQGRFGAWHGTKAEFLVPGEHGAGILAEGLTLEHAGKMNRLNSLMMRDGARVDLENVLGRALKSSEKKVLVDSHRAAVDTGGHVVKAIVEATNRIAKSNGVAAEAAKHLNVNLSERGYNLYMGNNAAGVLDWGKAGTEADMIARNMEKLVTKPGGMVRHQLGAMADIMVGGAGTVIERDIIDNIKFHKQLSKAPTVVVENADEAKKAVQGTLDRLVSRGIPTKNIKAVLGVSVGNAKLKAFADMPVVGTILGMNAGFQRMISPFLPNYNPARDLAVSQAIPRNHIYDTVLVDDAGKVLQRIKIKGAKKPTMLNPFSAIKNVRRAAFPLAVTAAGAAMMSTGILGKNPADYAAKKVREAFKKEARVLAPSTAAALKSSFKVGLGAGAIFGAGMTPVMVASYINNKRFPNRTQNEEIAGHVAENVGLNIAGQLGAYGSIIGAGVAPVLAGMDGALTASHITSAASGYMIGATATGMGATAVVSSRMQGEALKHSGRHGMLLLNLVPSDKLDSFIKEHPKEVALGATATAAVALPAAVAYTAKKHYSIAAEDAVRWAKDKITSEGRGLVSMEEAIAKGHNPPSLRSSIVRAAIPMAIACTVGAWLGPHIAGTIREGREKSLREALEQAKKDANSLEKQAETRPLEWIWENV